MKSSSAILFIVGILLLLGLYIYVDDRFTKMEVRLQGAESALGTLEPFRRMLAQAPGRATIENAYAPVQAAGEPDAAAEGRDSPLAWCPATENTGEEWLLLEFGERVPAMAVRVVANYHPGAVVRVEVLDDDGARTSVWTGAAAGDAAGFQQDFGFSAPRGVRRLRLLLDTAAVAGWNEIDAVGLIDAEGTVHWATGAEASTFWTREAVEAGPVGGAAPSTP